MAAEENTMVFRRLVEEGFNQGKLAVLDELVSQDIAEHEPGADIAPGVDGLKAFVSMMHAAFSDYHLTIEDLTASGDQVWARLTMRGTQTGALMGLPATGKQVAAGVIDICRFAGGKLVEHWGEADRLGTMQQLGAIPTQAPVGA